MVFQLPLRGPSGEPVDLWRTIVSHGVASLPPADVDEDARVMTVTVRLPRGRPRTIRIREGRAGAAARVEVLGPKPSASADEAIRLALRRMLNLDEDLGPLYAVAADDPDLAWITTGAGRMFRSPTVFEDVVKTICTTNCTWSATTRMVHAIVEHLGERAAGADPHGPWGRAFPTPLAMAEAGESFYKDVARAGYRGAYLLQLARSVAGGELDLEAFATASTEDLPDEELEERLLALPGVGPYAAAHIMMTIGRYHRLILDSWTRPTYAKKVRRAKVSDAAIERRFRRYGPYAGLAFWLYLTRDWVD